MTFATDIKRSVGGSMVVALGLASIGTGLFSAVPAAAAHPSALRFDADGIRVRVPLVPGAPRLAMGTASPLATSLPCDSQFHQVAGANPATATNVILNNGLAAISATDIWAVGAKADFTGTTIGPDAPLVERWDGSSWTSILVDNPSMMGSADLNAVATVPGATTATNNVFAVGNTFYVGAYHPLAEQWTGPGPPGSTGWNVVTPANLGTGDNTLYGVTAIAANNVWAVGDWRQDNGDPSLVPPRPPPRRQPLISHWDGTSFTSVTGPDPAWNSSDRLLGVSAAAVNDVWAVGRSIDGGGVQHALILHYNGTAWSITPAPNAGLGNNTLYAVAALSPTLAYAVGNFFDPLDPNRTSHTLLEKWDGTAWSLINAAAYVSGTTDNYLFSISALSPNNIWVGGATFAPNSTSTPSSTLVEHWDGFVWKVVPSPDGASGSFNEVNAILAITPSNIWTAGDYLNSAGTQGLTLFENLCISTPTVTGVAPVMANTTAGTLVAISGTDFNFATAVKLGAGDAPGWYVASNNQIIVEPQNGVAGTMDITVTNPAGTSATSQADTFIYVPPAVSWQQYSLPSSDGTTWHLIDFNGNLDVTFTPSVDSNAILSANADLWTSLAGVNQDLGIWVFGGTYGTYGTVVAWKESGGYAGTFSPNAAFVQTVIPVSSGIHYVARLVWKANKATTGTIFAAAGNSPYSYSPTRLTAELVPATSPNLKTTATNSQYWLADNDGTSWQDMDGTGGLTIASFTPAASGSALVSANADLWTATGGINQDIGIFISGGTFGTLGSTGTLVGWKESGGFAGTFSPNAAYAQSVVQLVGGTPYTIKVQWKANKNATGTIYAAAGSAGAYSPTRLTLRFFPGETGLQDASTNRQFNKVGSTGNDWTPIDATALKLTVTPVANSVYVLSANADLWTATGGVNQDVGIFVSGGGYGSGMLVAWKESGGFAGTFSPNAAFVQTVIPLATGVSYTITLEWKANKPTGGTIYAAAGNGPAYSPTRLTVQSLG